MHVVHISLTDCTYLEGPTNRIIPLVPSIDNTKVKFFVLIKKHYKNVNLS